MKYLCLIYDEEKTFAGMSKADTDAFMGEYFAFTEALQVAAKIPSSRTGSVEVRPIEVFG